MGIEVDREFTAKVIEMSGQNVRRCMQCAQCSGLCPMVASMDFTPRQVVHMVQMGRREALAGARSYWVCASCHTCMAQCPRDLDTAKIMEALRLMVLRGNRDRMRPESIPAEVFAEAPQMAFVSALRKLTA